MIGTYVFQHMAHPERCPWTIYADGSQRYDAEATESCKAIGDLHNGDTIVLVFNKPKGTLTLERDGRALVTQPLRLTPGTPPSVGDTVTIMRKHERREFKNDEPPRRGVIMAEEGRYEFMVDFGDKTRPFTNSDDVYEQVRRSHVERVPEIPANGVVPFVVLQTMNKITLSFDDVRWLRGEG